MDLDLFLMRLLNSIGQRYDIVDGAMRYLAFSFFFKGGISVSLLWAAWITSGRLSTDRVLLSRSVIGVVGSLIIARVLQNLLPIRLRPRFDPEMGLIPPPYSSLHLQDWSSFPSDHATMFFALSTAAVIVSYRAGLLAFAHAIVIVSLPRVYLGLHYPSDIIAGAAIGVATVLAAAKTPLPPGLNRIVYSISTKHEPMFMFSLCLVTFACATMFDDIRLIVTHFWHASKT